jgi:tetratricopeptide (TPR) repeat protein
MKKLKLFSLILIVIIYQSFAGNTLSPEKIFSQANQAYKQGNYQDAITLYEELLQKKYYTTEIFYNLGNAYYRTDKIALAILNYEKARLLSPGDDNINMNLRLANIRTTDKVPESNDFIMEFYHNFRDSMGSTGWAIIIILFIWLSCLALAGFIILHKLFIRKILFAAAIVMITLTVIFSVVGFNRYSFETNPAMAIVFSSAAPVKSSPDENGADLFFLHEGTKIGIIEENENWFKIRIMSDKVGWLPKTSVREIAIKGKL